MKEFGKRIKQLREEQGLTQKELGKKLGVYGPQIRKWESGTNLTSVLNLIQLAQSF